MKLTGLLYVAWIDRLFVDCFGLFRIVLTTFFYFCSTTFLKKMKYSSCSVLEQKVLYLPHTISSGREYYLFC